MNTSTELLRGLIGLFVDDELLAIGIVAVVSLTAFSALVLDVTPLAAGAILLWGNVFVLVAGAVRTARRR